MRQLGLVLLLFTAYLVSSPVDASPFKRNECEGYAARFDGTNWLDAGSGAWSRPESYTLEFWIKPGRTSAGSQGVIGNLIHKKQHGFGFGFVLEGNMIIFYDSQPFDDHLSAAIDYNRWTHIAGTHGPRGSSLYVNGELVRQRSDYRPVRYHTSEFLLGHTVGEASGLVGEIAEARLWDRQRSEEEIAASWNQPIISAAAEVHHGLTGYWAMRASGKFEVIDEAQQLHAHLAGPQRLPVLIRMCSSGCNNESRCVPSSGEASKRQETEALPDITINANAAQSSMYLDFESFNSTDCAVVEGCVGDVGLRTLLRFDTTTPNIGTAPLVLGNPATNDHFVYSSCHDHYHLIGYAYYWVLDQELQVAYAGNKQAFCIEDVAPDPDWLGPRSLEPVFTCSYQGLSIGWEDSYVSSLECQWIDITGIGAGSYWLYIDINPLINGTYHAFVESNYDNNVAWIPFNIVG